MEEETTLGSQSELDPAYPSCPRPDGLKASLDACLVRENQQRLLATIEEHQLESVPTPISYIDTDFRIVMANTSFSEAIGRRNGALPGRYCTEIIPDTELVTILRQVSEDGHAASFHDRPLVFEDQPERGITYWDWTLVPVKSAEGILDGFVLSLVDTTQRVRAAEVLQKASEELESKVRDRAAALQQVNIELASEVQRRGIAEAELRSLSRRLVQLQEEERRSISKELHDEVGQNLTILKMMLDTWLRRPEAVTPEVVKTAADQVSKVIAQVRNISMALHPSMLDVLGLEPALRDLFDRLRAQAGLNVDFNFDIDNSALNPEIKLCAYRVVQESLTNVLRYAGVNRASVAVNSDGDLVHISVSDSGSGFDYSSMNTGRSSGISGMRERVVSCGGTFQLATGVGQGTRIDVELPFRPPPEDRPA